MRGRIAAAVSICAVLVTGCASTVVGAGVRDTTGVTRQVDTGQPSPDSSSPAASGQSTPAGQSTPPSRPDTTDPSTASPIRPVPPVSTSANTPAGPTTSEEPATPTDPGTGTAAASSSTPSTSGSSDSSDPVGEFSGATAVDASTFPGTVTDVGFRAPSGNITCGIQAGTLVCQIDKYDYTPPAHDCGGSGWGFNFRLTGTGPAGLFCAGDVESGGPVLDYGRQISVGDLRCVSRQDGITCQNTSTGAGFRLARAAYTFFGPEGSSTVGSSSAAAAIPAALVGDWGGHGRSLAIDAKGAGTLTYRTYRFCSDDPTPPCDQTKGNEIYSGGQIDFALTAAAGAMSAKGTITASNDPQYPKGTPVTAAVSGYDLNLSFWPDSPFCAANTPSAKWNCGA